MQQRRFELVAFVLEVEDEFEDLEELVEDFVNGRLYAVGEGGGLSLIRRRLRTRRSFFHLSWSGPIIIDKLMR